MNCGDVVVMRTDKLYEPYGKPVTYYLVVEEHDRDLITVHDPITKDRLVTFASDLILISKCVNEKNF